MLSLPKDQFEMRERAVHARLTTQKLRDTHRHLNEWCIGNLLSASRQRRREMDISLQPHNFLGVPEQSADSLYRENSQMICSGL
jgi:hypothetical protein